MWFSTAMACTHIKSLEIERKHYFPLVRHSTVAAAAAAVAHIIRTSEFGDTQQQQQ
jgi:hypothetical protein